MNTMSTPTAQLVAGLLIGAAVVAAFAIGGDLSSALVSGGLVVAFVLFVYFGRRRSEASEVMSGIGDERTRSLYRDACAGRAEIRRSACCARSSPWRGRVRPWCCRGGRESRPRHLSRRRSSPSICAGSS
jgi:hypothetical protein